MVYRLDRDSNSTFNQLINKEINMAMVALRWLAGGMRGLGRALRGIGESSVYVRM